MPETKMDGMIRDFQYKLGEPEWCGMVAPRKTEIQPRPKQEAEPEKKRSVWPWAKRKGHQAKQEHK